MEKEKEHEMKAELVSTSIFKACFVAWFLCSRDQVEGGLIPLFRDLGNFLRLGRGGTTDARMIIGDVGVLISGPGVTLNLLNEG